MQVHHALQVNSFCDYVLVVVLVIMQNLLLQLTKKKKKKHGIKNIRAVLEGDMSLHPLMAIPQTESVVRHHVDSIGGSLFKIQKTFLILRVNCLMSIFSLFVILFKILYTLIAARTG